MPSLPWVLSLTSQFAVPKAPATTSDQFLLFLTRVVCAENLQVLGLHASFPLWLITETVAVPCSLFSRMNAPQPCCLGLGQEVVWTPPTSSVTSVLSGWGPYWGVTTEERCQ